MAAGNGFSKMSLADLRETHAKIGALITQREGEEKAAVRAKIQAMAAEAGLSIADVLGTPRKGRKNPNAVIRYRHPTDASLTWTGRGRKPKWLTGDKAQFAVAA